MAAQVETYFPADAKPKTLEWGLGNGFVPRNKWRGVKPPNVLSVTLSGPELAHAINVLGAAPVNKTEVTYFGDEARRIFFNW